MTNCPNCQKEVEEGFAFCPACGSGIAPAATTPDATAPAAPLAMAPPAQPDPQQVAAQLQLLAEKEAEKERKKAERLERTAAKKLQREQRAAQRKELQTQKKLQRQQQLAQRRAGGATVPGVEKPAAATSPIIWVLIILGIVLAMAASGAASYFSVKHFRADSSLAPAPLISLQTGSQPNSGTATIQISIAS